VRVRIVIAATLGLAAFIAATAALGHPLARSLS
jgi:hypothetical protein